MNKRNIIWMLLAFFSFIQLNSFAQGRRHMTEERREKLEAAKVAFLTERMDLSKEQAEKFWPVYNEFNKKRREAHQKSKVFKDNSLEGKSEKEIKESINKMLDMRQAELDIEKEYVNKFLKVISAKQLANMYKAEREFMKMLLHRLDEKRRPGRE